MALNMKKPSPPAPPLPPLTQSTIMFKNISINDHTSKKDSFYQPIICSWADDYPELKNTCSRFNICTMRPPFKFKYRKFRATLQKGPTCGIVAASMLLNVIPETLLKMAQERNYTFNGEMFSVKNMYKLLVESCHEHHVQNMDFELRVGDLCDPEVMNLMFDGAVLLVPYDADGNNAPCMKNGHKAHWALINGILLPEEPTFDDGQETVQVLALHGKSIYLALWSLKYLQRSNQNLYEFSPNRLTDHLKYVVPDDGIASEDGLRNQFIVCRFLSA